MTSPHLRRSINMAARLARLPALVLLATSLLAASLGGAARAENEAGAIVDAAAAGIEAVIPAVAATSARSEAGSEQDSAAIVFRDDDDSARHAASARPVATRFVIGLQQGAGYKVSALINPNRVVIDLDTAAIELPPPVGEAPAGVIKTFRSGVSAPGKSRVVIELVAPVVVSHKLSEAAGAHRLVVDLTQATASHAGDATADEAASTGGGVRVTASPPMPRRTTQHEVGARVYKPTIVIDPGHGGIDSGAQKFGTVEKEVVLAFGHRLKAKLEATGRYKVLMTRETDVFVELDERRRFAERHEAALFIAIHADSANTGARGATVYSLRQSVADDMMTSAKDEARKDVLSREEVRAISADAAEASAVRGFLTDLAQREVEVNRNRTNVFTRSIIEYMGRSTNLKDNPDRSAQYRVLKTVKMPAVLIELAYVSNEEDASNLRSDVWRDKVTQSIATAIENYFSQNIASLPL